MKYLESLSQVPIIGHRIKTRIRTQLQLAYTVFLHLFSLSIILSVSLLDPHGTGVIDLEYWSFTSSSIDQLLSLQLRIRLGYYLKMDQLKLCGILPLPISHPNMLRSMGIIEETREIMGIPRHAKKKSSGSSSQYENSPRLYITNLEPFHSKGIQYYESACPRLLVWPDFREPVWAFVVKWERIILSRFIIYVLVLMEVKLVPLTEWDGIST